MKKVTNEIAKSVASKLISGADAQAVLKGLRTALTKNNKQHLLPSVLKKVRSTIKEQDMFETLIIETPFEVSEISQKSVTKSLNIPETVRTEIVINKSLLAGFRAKWRGTIYDGSARRIITALKQK